MPTTVTSTATPDRACPLLTQFLLVDRSEIQNLREALSVAAAQLDAIRGPVQVPEVLDVDVLSEAVTGPLSGQSVTVAYTASDAVLDDGESNPAAGTVTISHWRHGDRVSGLAPSELPAIIDTITDVARRLGVIA